MGGSVCPAQVPSSLPLSMYPLRPPGFDGEAGSRAIMSLSRCIPAHGAGWVARNDNMPPVRGGSIVFFCYKR